MREQFQAQLQRRRSIIDQADHTARNNECIKITRALITQAEILAATRASFVYRVIKRRPDTRHTCNASRLRREENSRDGNSSGYLATRYSRGQSGKNAAG